MTAVKKSEWRYLLLVVMHFQDVYNYQIPRVQRCVIHFATPYGRLYPFCTYNCGPVFRNRVEGKFSVPLSKWRAVPADPDRRAVHKPMVASEHV